jgi:hypothetical protein
MLIQYDGFDKWEDREEIREFEEPESEIKGMEKSDGWPVSMLVERKSLNLALVLQGTS